MNNQQKPSFVTAVLFILIASFLIYLSFLSPQSDPILAESQPTVVNYLPSVFKNYVTPSPTPTATPTATPTSVVLTPPTLISPAPNALGAKFTFDWSDVSGASSYTFQLSTTSTFNTIAFTTSVVDSEYTYTSTLSGSYYWRVFVPSEPYSDTRAVSLVNYAADDDGDNLPNGWELHGYDANNDGTIDVNLPALGANYDHKDIFIEMDYMTRVSASNGLGPNQTVLDAIEAVFANSPMTNPDGVDGIDIHLELDEEVPYDADLNPYATEFYALKAVYFDATNRAAVYHYMIWANGYNGGSSSGVSFGIPATDFIVTLGLWGGGNGGTDAQKVGTFIHELGHNLSLTHGGTDHSNYKPNYLSVMNYFFQTWGLYINGAWGDQGNWLNFDYQRFDLPALNETNLNENVGLNGGTAVTGYGVRFYCNSVNKYALPGDGAIDWNCDGDTADTGVVMDINNSGGNSTLSSQNNWDNIDFSGNGVIGSGLSGDLLAVQIETNFKDTELDELTYEMLLEMESSIDR
jgi:hypothetical protein